MDGFGQMLKWAVELNMFNLAFEPRKAIKGQALADFIVELTRATIEIVRDPAGGWRPALDAYGWWIFHRSWLRGWDNFPIARREQIWVGAQI